MSKSRASVAILGVFAGLGGASHGPGEMLQGNVAPSEMMIRAWPSLTALNGEPAMTLAPSFLAAGILTVVFSLVLAFWAAAFAYRKYGGLLLILLSIVMLLVGGGIIPPFFGVAAGIISILTNYRVAKQGSVE